jgi:hypothetical protein
VINPILDNNLCLPTVAAANGEKATQFCRRLPMLAAALSVMIAQGYGQTINFVATDIYRIADARIAESWHFDRNLTLHKQLTAE